MEKAYDVKDLVAKLKSRGLDVAEEAGKVVAEEAFAWLEESAKLSANVYDNMALLILPEVKKFVFEKIDSIDGKVG